MSSDHRPPEETRRERRLLAALARHPAWVLGVASFLVAGFVFRGAGLYGDDTTFLQRFLPALDGVGELFVLPASFRDWFGPLHRPLSLGTWQLDRAWFGEDWAGFHWHQAFWYGLTVAGFSLVSLRLFRAGANDEAPGRPRAAAWWAGALFAMHPVHVETAAWIATRHDVVFAALLLFALTSGMRACEADRPRSWALLTAALGFLSIQAKEAGYAFLPLLAGWILIAVPRDRRRWRVLLPSAVAVVGALTLSFAVGGGEQKPVHQDAATRLARAFGWDLQQSFLPWSPRIDYHPDPGLWWAVFALVVVVGWATYGLLRVRRGDPLPAFALLFGAGLAGTTWPVAWSAFMDSIVADRYLLLPAGAAVWLLVHLACRCGRRGAALLGVVGLAYLVQTVPYARAWAQGGVPLAEELVARSPESVTTRVGSVALAVRAGDADRALAFLTAKPALEPLPHERSGLEAAFAQALGAQGSWLEAAGYARAAVESSGRDAVRRLQLAKCLYEAFRKEVAHPDPTANLGVVLPESRRLLAELVEEDPRSYRAWLYLGRAQASFADFDAARASLDRAAKLGSSTLEGREARLRQRLLPDSGDFGGLVAALRVELEDAPAADDRMAGVILWERAQDRAWLHPGGVVERAWFEQAGAFLERAVRKDAEDSTAWLYLGFTQASVGDFTGAALSFRRVVDLGRSTHQVAEARDSLDRLLARGPGG